jgi:hypothetical protein
VVKDVSKDYGIYLIFDLGCEEVGLLDLDIDAPDGTAAVPINPLSRYTSTSTVGFPRESNISRPITLTIPNLIINLLK